MNRTDLFALVLVTLLLLSFPGCGAGDIDDLYPLLETIRDAIAGTEMTVEGFISVEPGTFESSTGEAGFAIQDVTAGVYVQVSATLALDLSGLSLGDRVRVTGIVGDLDQLVTLTIDEMADILLLSGGFIFFPQDLQTVDTDPGCVSPREDCSNGIDDDGDALVDCDDPDCSSDPNCIPPVEDCSNGIDDDGDALVDCDDPDCSSDPNCVPPMEDCSNGIDDDGDALVDCDDPDCSFQSTPELESKIVNLTGIIVVDPGGSGETVVRDEDPGGELFGWKIWLDDGSGVAQTFWHPTADMDPEALTFLTAGTPMRINGFLNRHIDQYEVFPRGDFDVSIPIATARSLPDGDKVLVRGLIGLGPASLVTEGDFGFSLHEDNGDGTQDGIFVSIASNAIVIGNYAGNPMSLADLISFVNFGHRRVHVSGILGTTVGADRIIAVGNGDVRLLSEDLDFPAPLVLATGAVSANLGRWVEASGFLQTPPAGAALGTFSGWTIGPGGFQARINGGSGNVNILFPFEVFGDLNGDGSINLGDILYGQVTGVISFDMVVGGNLQVRGFVRNHDGETEIVVPFNLPAYIN